MTEIPRQRVHIAIQIEGNTDSSFQNDLGKIYGAERVLVYDLSSKKFNRLSDLNSNPAINLLKIGKNLLENTPLFPEGETDDEVQSPDGQWFSRSNLPPETAAVHGLFTPSFFKGIFENPFISVILRDPLERTITLYNEWNEKKGDVEWRFSIPFDSELTFTEFATQEDLINYQSQCLGSRRLGDYDLVGVAECQEGFIAQLQNKDWTGYVNSQSKPIKLSKPRYKKLGITPDFLNEFQELNQLDYSIYRQAREFMGFC